MRYISMYKAMNDHSNDRARMRGSVFIFLLIGVVLFGAVAIYVVRADSTAVSSSLSQSEARTRALALINYSNAVRNTVEKLLANGCSEREISFSQPPSYATYVNPNSPTDRRCHVFAPEGGKLRATSFQQLRVDDRFVSPRAWPQNDVLFQGSGTSIAGNGPTNPQCDLTFWIANIDTAVCQEINKILKIPTPNGNPPRDNLTSLGGGSFVGNYASFCNARSLQLWGSANEFVGRPMGCFVTSNYNIAGCPGCDRNYFGATLIGR